MEQDRLDNKMNRFYQLDRNIENHPLIREIHQNLFNLRRGAKMPHKFEMEKRIADEEDLMDFTENNRKKY